MKKTLLLLSILLGAWFQAAAQPVVTVSGEITASTTWTKNNIYLLSGFVYVEDGATLTIEAGTLIKGDKASKGALIVARGSKLIAKGTAAEPIVFTSNEATPSYGDWGGIILLGKAPTNTSTNGMSGIGIIEGGVDTPEGDGRYGGGDLPGGSDAADNSGELRYVRIEYPGIAFQPNNEINGLTMGGVGSGTKIEYVEVAYAGDDSFEWFGGTVNAKYLIAYRGLDDDFDADFGYNGRVQFALAVRDPQIADVSGSNGLEIDNDAAGSNNTPKTAPIFSNFTVIGPGGASVNSNYKRAAHLRRNNEINIYNSVFLGAYPDAGLLIDGGATALNAQTGLLTVRNSFFYGMPTPIKTNDSLFNLTIGAWAAANGVVGNSNAALALLTDPFNFNDPNPRPLPNSPLLDAADFALDTLIDDFFFSQVSFAGAFGPSGDWTCPWARFGQPLSNSCLPENQEVVVASNISSNTTWTADKVYVLQGFIYVTNCATLTIEPGTVIKGDKASKGALIVTRCAKIIADGTEGEPIVFTTNDPSPSYGSWGGLILLGYAPTNTSTNAVACLGVIEGGVNTPEGYGLYGSGDQPGGCGHEDDNSGILRYVRIEYPGIAFQPNSEINGLTMGGVGNGTTIDYVQVSYSGDDSYEWFGGTVNAKHIIAYRGLDDDFDADFGFRGNVQYAFSVRDPQIADVSGSNGFEIDNDAAGSTNTPKTAPTFSNVTILGPAPGATANSNYKRGAHLRRNSEAGIFNTLILGNWLDAGIFIDGTTTAANATNNLLEVKNTYVAGMPTPLKTTDAGFNITNWFNTSGWGNTIGASAAAANLVNPFNLNLPNAAPLFNSPAVEAGAFTSARVNVPFFDKVDFIGAFNSNDDWTCGWARFETVNTNCFLVNTKNAEKFITGVKLYPTITSSQATLELNLTAAADLSVAIFGINGQFHGQPIQSQAFAGEQTYTLNVANLPAGIYLVRIQAGAAVKTQKLIIE